MLSDRSRLPIVDELSGNLGVPQLLVLHRNATRVRSFHKAENQEAGPPQTLQSACQYIWGNHALHPSRVAARACHVFGLSPNTPRERRGDCFGVSVVPHFNSFEGKKAHEILFRGTFCATQYLSGKPLGVVAATSGRCR